ncbi:MAG: FHA domain-containing protein [Candidatus Methylacidiphilales bacterium]
MSVRDLQSRNGTFLNGLAITRSRAKHDDVLCLECIQFALIVKFNNMTPKQKGHKQYI